MGKYNDDSLGCDAHLGESFLWCTAWEGEGTDAVSPRRWSQMVTLRVGLSKLSSVTWPCVECVPAGRTQSNLLILIRLSAAGDREAPWEPLETDETRDIPSTSYRVSTAQLYLVARWQEEEGGGGADVVEETSGRICWRGKDPKHNRFGPDDRYGIGWWCSLRLAFSYPCERVGGGFG